MLDMRAILIGKVKGQGVDLFGRLSNKTKRMSGAILVSTRARNLSPFLGIALLHTWKET
jgi:hypothetical protein